VATFTFRTLGCRANQYDTNVLVSDLIGWGCKVADGAGTPDLVLINTCAVTGTAERKSRQAIRRARRLYPRAAIAVLGCLPTLDRDGVLALGADLAIPNPQREYAARTIADALGLPAAASAGPVRRARPGFWGRTRAFVKIQDGCDHFCSYCIVAHLRGPMRSRPADEVIAEVAGFAESGHREIVLTGIRTGAYDSGIDLVGLIERIAGIPGIARIRLSSIEPMDFGDRLIECLRRVGKLCPHVHVPLQSASERVLADMRRGYTPEEYAALIRRVREVRSGCAVTTDVLVGYPTEGEDEFAATKNFVAEQGFSRLHVFQYSPRPGTAAEKSTYAGSPEMDRVRRRRSEEMIRLSRDLALGWNRGWVGRTAEVLVEEDGTGYTPDYVRARLEGGESHAGDIVPARISGADPEGLRGSVEEVDG
jgi:threonylcarbamoyladenosine tRNA methylthiotransferase MtaB